MITIAETAPANLNVESSPLMIERPRQFRLRTSSESIADGRHARRTTESDGDELLVERNVVQRSASCSAVYAHRRELYRAQLNREDTRHRVTLRCRDEGLCVRSQANVLRLVETVQKQSASSTSVLLAKKALKYRRLLDRAEQVNLSDPSVDVAEFLFGEPRSRTELVGFRKHSPAP